MPVYIDGGQLYLNGWNLSSSQDLSWSPVGLNGEVLANTAYVVVLEMDSFSETFEGFVNGQSIGMVDGIGTLYKHADKNAFGHVEGTTLFHDRSTGGPANFKGYLAEFYSFNAILLEGERKVLEDELMGKYVR